MYQVPMRVWNEIAQTQPIKHEPWATLFRLEPEQLPQALQPVEADLEAQGADPRTIRAYLLVAPCLLENEAISAYLEQTEQISLRNSLPDLADLSEAVMVASEEFRLNTSQRALLRRLLVRAYRTTSAPQPSAQPTPSP